MDCTLIGTVWVRVVATNSATNVPGSARRTRIIFRLHPRFLCGLLYLHMTGWNVAAFRNQAACSCGVTRRPKRRGSWAVMARVAG